MWHVSIEAQGQRFIGKRQCGVFLQLPCNTPSQYWGLTHPIRDGLTQSGHCFDKLSNENDPYHLCVRVTSQLTGRASHSQVIVLSRENALLSCNNNQESGIMEQAKNHHK